MQSWKEEEVSQWLDECGNSLEELSGQGGGDSGEEKIDVQQHHFYMMSV